MLPLVSLSGSAFAQGVLHGQVLRREIRHNLSLYFRRFTLEIGLPQDEVLRRAALYLGGLETLHPEYLAGVRGIAQGSGVSLAEVAALNVRYEILYDGFGRTGGGIDGCTSFALTPERTGGPLLLGENWDWIPEVKGALIATQTEGMRVLGFTEAGIFGPKLGLNSAGLGLVINGLTSTEDDPSRLGLPFHARCYDILRSHTLDAAEEAARVEPRSCSANFLLAQTPESVRNLEVAPHTVRTLYPENGALVHANHFSDPAVQGSGLAPGSVARQRRLSEQFSGRAISLNDVQTSLRDSRAPDAVCRHPDLNEPDFERYATVVSAVINLSERVLYISDGPPDTAPYVRVTLDQAASAQAVSGTPP